MTTFYTNEVWTEPEQCTCGRRHPHSLTPHLRDNLPIWIKRGSAIEVDRQQHIPVTIYEDVTGVLQFGVGPDDEYRVWGDDLSREDIEKYQEEVVWL